MPDDLHKYVVGVDGATELPFVFTYEPAACGFWKVYEIDSVI